jgi:hypothetical protein
MTVGAALRLAVVDMYHNSWRLLLLNSAVTAAISVVVLVVSAFPLVLFVGPLVAGPVAAALAYCVVLLVRDESFELADALRGLRTFWKTGFLLGGLFGAGALLGALAFSYYAHRVVALAVLSLYVASIFALVVLVAWPFAVAEEGASVRDALWTAWLLTLRAPVRLFTLGAALLVVNALGAATVLPFLTLTIAYSFLATARFVLPAQTLEEVPA